MVKRNRHCAPETCYAAAGKNGRLVLGPYSQYGVFPFAYFLRKFGEIKITKETI